MGNLESYRKQAKLLVRWHREGNSSIGGRLRGLSRFREITDQGALAMTFPLALAQEIVAAEAGHPSWGALKQALAGTRARARSPVPELRLQMALPVLYVLDVRAAAGFWRDKLGFRIDFLHGNPPFYGAVSRDGACLHLKFVHEPVFGPGRTAEEGLIMAYVPVANIKGLYAEYHAKGVEFSQTLTKQAWGGTDCHVVDPDGNRVAFVG